MSLIQGVWDGKEPKEGDEGVESLGRFAGSSVDKPATSGANNVRTPLSSR